MEVEKLVRVPLSLFTRLRLILLGHEELVGVVFWAALVGFCGALASVVFREAARMLEHLFTGESGSLVHAAESLVWWYRMLVPAVGGLLAGWVLHVAGRAFTAARAVDYMEAVLLGDGHVGLRGTLLKCLSSLLSIASGGSIGREGPMVQLAAALGSKLGTLARAPVPRLRLMVACGGAAGIAAAYNAPISGALFISEIVLGSIAMESFGPLVVSSVVASATIHRFLGYGPVFDVPHVVFVSNWELVFYALLGVLLGHLAPLFLGLLDFSKRCFVKLNWAPYWTLGLGGLLVGITSIAVPQVWGNGYSVVGDILQGQVLSAWLAVVLIAKVFATSSTVGSGAVGGVFTPTLFIGAAIGTLVGDGLHSLLPTIVSTPAAYALIGMGGFLAATTHAPLTSMLMIFEMTLDYDMALPLMLSCVIAHYTAKVYRGGESIYHASLTRTMEATDQEDWRLKTVAALVKPAIATAARDVSIGDALAKLPKRPIERLYVTDEDEIVGWLDPRKILARLERKEISATLPIESVAERVTFTLTPDMPLCTALDGFLREGVTILPVTPDQWRNTLLGEVSRHDLLLAVQDRLTYPK
ncbi:MAG TPA: ClcB-like voltage-gated chloride channel protein [Steroidobacteraceae bacterium]|nr:ClcB-like voltage-gated chloride channel protein [Steroidobacteraceae bacterium]